jgi:hypothetical protein
MSFAIVVQHTIGGARAEYLGKTLAPMSVTHSGTEAEHHRKGKAIGRTFLTNFAVDLPIYIHCLIIASLRRKEGNVKCKPELHIMPPLRTPSLCRKTSKKEWVL